MNARITIQFDDGKGSIEITGLLQCDFYALVGGLEGAKEKCSFMPLCVLPSTINAQRRIS